MSVIILGAGATGLGTALGFAMDRSAPPVTLIEKAPRPGGLAGSFRWKGHTVDFGPHRLSPNIEEVRVLAREMLGTDCLIKKNQNGVEFRGKLYQFPIRAADWADASSLGALVLLGSSFLWEKIAWIPRRFENETFESAIVRKFGRCFYDWIAHPMAEKVWSRASSIDPAFVNQRFASVHPWQILKKMVIPRQELHPSDFYYPRKGFQQLWDSIVAYLTRQGQQVLLGAEPVEIRVRDHKIVRVDLQTAQGPAALEGEDLQIVSTIPIVSLVRLMRGIDTEPLIELSRGISVRSMVLVPLEFDGPSALPFRAIQFPESRFCFNRLMEQNAYSRETVEAGKSVVVADVTVPRDSDEWKRSDAEWIESVKRDLTGLAYVPLDRLRDAHVQRVEFAYMVPDTRTRSAMHRIRQELQSVTNLELAGRFSSGEYDNSDYALDNGLTLSRMLTGLKRSSTACMTIVGGK